MTEEREVRHRAVSSAVLPTHCAVKVSERPHYIHSHDCARKATRHAVWLDDKGHLHIAGRCAQHATLDEQAREEGSAWPDGVIVEPPR